MDDHRSADALTDAALERELEAALAVDPSPELAARVRTRVQRERDASLSPWPWGVAAAGAILVIAALVVGMSGPTRSQIVPNAPVAQDFSPAPKQDLTPVPVPQDVSPPPNRVVTTSSRRSASHSEPQLLMAADEARALRRLFADVGKGLIDLSSLQEGPPATAALQPAGEIAFPPITFEPIATAIAESIEEGERQ